MSKRIPISCPILFESALSVFPDELFNFSWVLYKFVCFAIWAIKSSSKNLLKYSKGESNSLSNEKDVPSK